MRSPRRVQPLSILLSFSLVAIVGIVALQQTSFFQAEAAVSRGYCGDGIKNGTEQCDLGIHNGPRAQSRCSKQCTLRRPT